MPDLESPKTVSMIHLGKVFPDGMPTALDLADAIERLEQYVDYLEQHEVKVQGKMEININVDCSPLRMSLQYKLAKPIPKEQFDDLMMRFKESHAR